VCNEDARPIVSSEINKELAELIRACWQKEAKERPDFKKIVEQLKED